MTGRATVAVVRDEDGVEVHRIDPVESIEVDMNGVVIDNGYSRYPVDLNPGWSITISADQEDR